jgi:hypothetical protein
MKPLTEGENRGKEWSFRTKLLAGVFVVTASILNWAFGWEIDQWSIIQVGIFVGALFVPVDLSKIAGNIRQGGRT